MEPTFTLNPDQQARLDALLAKKAAEKAAVNDNGEVSLNPEQQARLDALLAKKNAPNPFDINQADKSINAGLENLRSMPRDILQGAVASVPKLGQVIVKGATKLAPTSVQNNPWVKNITNFDWDQFTAPIGSGKTTMGSDIARQIGGYLPYGVGEAAALPSVGKSILGKMITSGGVNAVNTLAEGGDSSDAKLNAAIGAVTPGILGQLEKLRPAKALRGTLTNEQLQQNLANAQGTKTGLGNVIDNITLQDTMSNLLPKIPGSGANKAMQQTGQAIVDRGNALLEKIRGDADVSDIGGQLQQTLKESSREVQRIKRANYDALNQAADKAGLADNDANLIQTAKNKLDEIKSNPRLAREVPSSVMADLEEYSNPMANARINPATGLAEKPTQSLKDADIFRGKLGDKAQVNYENGDSYVSGIYKDLKEAKQADIDQAINQQSDQSIKDLRDQAHAYYRENVVPFEEPEVVKFTRKGGDPDTLLTTFLQTSRTQDKSRLLSKLMDKLPQKQKSLVPYAYYSRSIDKLNGLDPQKLATLHRQLGKSQENVLLSPLLKKELDDYVGMVNMNKEALNIHFNPKTGVRTNSMLIPGVAANAATAGWASGGLPGAAIGLALGTGLPTLAARGATKALTSQTVRENLVKEMLKNRNRFANPAAIGGTQAVTQGILKALQGGQ